ncbi:hypothetical protein RYX36_002469 [Vicia faba]
MWSYYLPFSKEFQGDYHALQSKSTPTIISMKNNLLLRLLMLEDANQKRRDKVDNEMGVKLQKHVNASNEYQRLLKALQKDKES